MKKIIFVFLLALMIFLPAVSFAAEIIPCGTTANPEPCGFYHLLELINNVVKFVLYMSVSIAAIAFCYAGFLLLTSGGSEEAKSKAKSIFTNVAIGIFFVAASWLIINTILTLLGYDGSWIGF